MKDRRREDRLYTAVMLAFLVGLVALGLLGVPALLVAAIGLVVAAVGIVLFRATLEGRSGSPAGQRASGSTTSGPRRRVKGGDRVPARYVPSVLAPATARPRRGLHFRSRSHA
jgi:hypothetical protein